MGKHQDKSEKGHDFQSHWPEVDSSAYHWHVVSTASLLSTVLGARLVCQKMSQWKYLYENNTKAVLRAPLTPYSLTSSFQKNKNLDNLPFSENDARLVDTLDDLSISSCLWAFADWVEHKGSTSVSGIHPEEDAPSTNGGTNCFKIQAVDLSLPGSYPLKFKDLFMQPVSKYWTYTICNVMSYIQEWCATEKGVPTPI